MQNIIANLKQYLVNQISTHGIDILKNVLLAIGIFLLLYIGIKFIVRFTKKKIEQNHLGNHNDIEKVSSLISSIVFILLSIFNFLIFLQILGLDVAILMGGISLGLAFALETVISNMIAGIMIVLNKKFTIGDLLTVEGTINMTGYIQDITLRYTVIKTFDRRKTIIPNTELVKSPFRTIKTEKYVRGEISIHVPRHVAIEQVKKLILNTVNKNENIVQPDFTSVIVSGFDEKGIKIKGFFLVNPAISGTGFVTKTQLKKEIHAVFQTYGIKIPYFHISLDT